MIDFRLIMTLTFILTTVSTAAVLILAETSLVLAILAGILWAVWIGLNLWIIRSMND
jgi:hypothetical protein